MADPTDTLIVRVALRVAVDVRTYRGAYGAATREGIKADIEAAVRQRTLQARKGIVSVSRSRD